jgi:hypothetical protein
VLNIEAAPQMTDAPVQARKPSTNSRRAPSRSPIVPAVRMNAAKAIV